MNYQKIHDQIIQRAQNEQRVKTKDGTYYELHHILPKCLGGTNSKENLVLLTAKEHYLVHLILAKLNSDCYCLLQTLNIIIRNIKRTNIVPTGRVYEELKKKSAKLHSIIMQGKNTGIKSKETRYKMSLSAKKRISEGSYKNNLLKGVQGKKFSNRKKRTLSEETKNKIGNAHRGKIVSEDTKERLRRTQKEKSICMKPVLQFTLNNKFINEFPSIKDAIKETKIFNIGPACRGKLKQSGGFIWKFKNYE